MKKLKDILGDDLMDLNSTLGENFMKTNICSIDQLMGGLPHNVIIELYGHEGSGKSSLAMHFVKVAQQEEKCQLYVDAEGGICNLSYIESLGIDKNKLLVYKNSCGDKVFEACCAAVGTGEVNLIIIDSLAALMSKDEIEGEGEMIGSFSRMVSKKVKKLVAALHCVKEKVVVIVINQMRSKINDMWKGEMNTTTTGGKSIKYFSSLRIEVQRDDFLVLSTEVVGMNCKMKIVKSRFCSPMSTYNLPFLFKDVGKLSKGFSRELELVYLGCKLDIIKSGSWWRIVDVEDKSFRNVFSVAEYLLNDKVLYDKIESKFREKEKY